MATAATIINRALRLLGRIGAGASGTTDEIADGLIALNAMIGAWRNDRLMCYAILDQSVTLASGNSTRTIGPTGSTVTTRPVHIESAYVVVSNASYDVKVLTFEEYAAIPDKTATSEWPTKIYYAPDMPDGTIYNYPVPSGSSALHLLIWTVLAELASSSTTVSLPPGYEDALAFNLAIRIAPEYEREPSQTVIQMARETKAAIKRVNLPLMKLYTELPWLVGTNRGRIITDQPR